jgi:hypothetical protein
VVVAATGREHPGLAYPYLALRPRWTVEVTDSRLFYKPHSIAVESRIRLDCPTIWLLPGIHDEDALNALSNRSFDDADDVFTA